MDAEGAVPVGTNLDTAPDTVAPKIDYMKLTWDMYTSDDWIRIVMENNNDYY